MSKQTLLIVDDELVVRRVVGDALARAGYVVELASSGAEALARLQHPGIDLLLLDLQLGDMDGVQVMETARELWPTLPIVMLTAHGSLPSAIAAVRCGAADYLLKPISIEELRERVASVLSKQTSSRARVEYLQSMYAQMQALLQSEGLLQEARGAPLVEAAPEVVLQSGPLQVDTRQHTVMMNTNPVDVTPSEFAILVELVNNSGAVVSCTQLARATSTAVVDEEEARQIIRPHIVRLRRKLELDPQQPRFLISVRGIGYRWVSSGSGIDS